MTGPTAFSFESLHPQSPCHRGGRSRAPERGLEALPRLDQSRGSLLPSWKTTSDLRAQPEDKALAGEEGARSRGDPTSPLAFALAGGFPRPPPWPAGGAAPPGPRGPSGTRTFTSWFLVMASNFQKPPSITEENRRIISK